MFCSRCGTSIPDDTAVCPNCRTILSNNQTSSRDVRPQPGCLDTDYFVFSDDTEEEESSVTEVVLESRESRESKELNPQENK